MLSCNFQGESPYKRPTYRYTPLIAWMLQPNILVSPAFGKLLFIVLDIAAGYLTYSLLLSVGTKPNRAVTCACFWLLNPLPMGVSSRGSAESILALLVLLIIKFRLEGKLLLSAALYGLAVHIKIYPVIYAIPLWLDIDRSSFPKRVYPFLGRLLNPTYDRVKYFIVAAAVFGAVTGYLLFFVSN